MKTLGVILSILLLSTSCGRIVSGLKNQLRSSIAAPVNQTLVGISNSATDSLQVNQNSVHIFSVKDALAEKFGF